MIVHIVIIDGSRATVNAIVYIEIFTGMLSIIASTVAAVINIIMIIIIIIIILVVLLLLQCPLSALLLLLLIIRLSVLSIQLIVWTAPCMFDLRTFRYLLLVYHYYH